MNLKYTIIPKADQTNADDLIAGPMTIKVTAVEPGNAEQPVMIRYEGDNGRPWKPSKGMRRVLVSMWGLDGAVYVGRKLTLYRDPNVTFGPDTTGGIRISHASDIAEEMNIALTVKRGKRKPFIVQPLIDSSPQQQSEDPPFDLQSLTDVGDSKAREGMDALKAWWLTLPKKAKAALTAKKDGEWKTLAEGVVQAGAK